MVFHFIPCDSIITDWINSSLVVTLLSSFALRRGNRLFRRTLKGQNLLYCGHLKLRWFYHAAWHCRCLGWSKYHCNLLCFLAFRVNCALCFCLRWNLFSLSFIISLVTPNVKQQIDGQKGSRKLPTKLQPDFISKQPLVNPPRGSNLCPSRVTFRVRWGGRKWRKSFPV